MTNNNKKNKFRTQNEKIEVTKVVTNNIWKQLSLTHITQLHEL